MFSTTCKYNSSKHNELINKKKIHEIADKPSKEPSCYKNSPNFFYLKKRHHANRGQDLRNTKKSNPSMEKHVYDMSQTPMAFQRDSNLLPSRGLVRM
jgi:beta-xylosidase